MQIAVNFVLQLETGFVAVYLIISLV